MVIGLWGLTATSPGGASLCAVVSFVNTLVVWIPTPGYRTNRRNQRRQALVLADDDRRSAIQPRPHRSRVLTEDQNRRATIVVCHCPHDRRGVRVRRLSIEEPDVRTQT